MHYSPTLREALALRSARKIPEAHQKLEKACEEKDPYAYFFLSRAYLHGGWGLNRNFIKHDICEADAEKLGFKRTEDIEIACHFDTIGDLPYSLEVAERLNDARYWYIFGYKEDKYRKYAYERAAEQNHSLAISKLIEFYGLNSIKSVKLSIQGRMYLQQEEIIRFSSEFSHLIGREIYRDNMHPLRNSDAGKKSVSIYLNRIERVRSEIFTWLLISKYLMMPRDMRNSIALEIWRLRDDIRL
jgi:hypothetical protein